MMDLADKTIICTNCGNSHIIDLSEYNYQVNRGRKNFFCSMKCAAAYNNTRNKKPAIQKACEWCGQPFECKTPYTKRFCSRSCASAGSITPKRLEGNRIGGAHSTQGHSIYSIQKLLKQREAWKYEEIGKLLDTLGISHEFEYVVGDKYIFDLLIPEWNVLIEFDSNYHNAPSQLESDIDKSKCATEHGYTLIRIQTPTNVVLAASCMYDVISQYRK